MSDRNRRAGRQRYLARFLACGAVGLTAVGVGIWNQQPPAASVSVAAPPKVHLPPSGPPALNHPATRPPAEDPDATYRTIRALEGLIARDPENTIAYNKLTGYYLQRVRETGDLTYLELASRASRTSLAVLPAERNSGGLALLAQTQYAAHDFAQARDHAVRLTTLEPKKASSHQILGDALLELGDYEGAATAFHRMEQLGGSSINAETRMARLAMLRGDIEMARRRFSKALVLAIDNAASLKETVAWCQWQLGETAFTVGDYDTAERHYREALTTFPQYLHAVASLGRVRAARGDVRGAIQEYELAVQRLPDPELIAKLGDLYAIAGRADDARAQYVLVEQIGRLDRKKDALYNRQLALFYADHDMAARADEAFASAVKEYEIRRDIYGADAVAWTALKAGRLSEAQRAMTEALRLGTKDARLFYHAGMIARAGGNDNAARDYLRNALSLNPQFDPLQASIARKALGE